MTSEYISFSEFLPMTGNVPDFDFIPIQSFVNLARNQLNYNNRTDDDVIKIAELLNLHLAIEIPKSEPFYRSTLSGFLSLMNKYHDQDVENLAGFYWFECFAVLILSIVNSVLLWTKQTIKNNEAEKLRVKRELHDYLIQFGDAMNLLSYSHLASKIGTMGSRLIDINLELDEKSLSKNGSRAAAIRHEPTNKFKQKLLEEYDEGQIGANSKWTSMSHAAQTLHNRDYSAEIGHHRRYSYITVYKWIIEHNKLKKTA